MSVNGRQLISLSGGTADPAELEGHPRGPFIVKLRDAIATPGGDLFARRVVGWSVSADLDATIAVTALRRALALRPAPAGMIHHSERGVHYACAAYRAVLAAHGVKPSMSRKGNCWDNAVAESFFSSLKFEVELDAKWNDVHDVERDISEYIDGFYNSQRRHSHNQYLSPVDFERQFVQQGIAA